MNKTDDNSKPTRSWWSHEIAPSSLKELSDSDRKNAKSLNHWFLVWAIVFFGVVLGIKPLVGDVESTPLWLFLPALAAVVTTALLIRAYIHFYRNTKDELIRKIHYESLAIGFGVAFFLGACFAVSKMIFGNLGIAGPLTWAGMLVAYFTSYALLINRNRHV